MNKKAKFLLFFSIFFIYLIVLCYTSNHLQIALAGDAKEYLKEADNLLQYRTFYCGDLSERIEPQLYSRRPPLYPLLLAILIFLFKKYNFILFFQILLTFLNGYIILKILDLQQISSKWQMTFAMLFLLYPTQIIFTHLIMSEILLQTFLLLSFFFFTKYFSSKRIGQLLFLNLCLAGALLTKPIMLYIYVINLLWHVWLFFKEKRKTILILPLIMILTIFIWSYRNYRATGVFHYSSIKIHNLLNYNVRGFLANKYGTQYANEIVKTIEINAAEKSSYKETYNYIEKESLDIIKNNLIGYSFYHFKGMLNFFIDPGRFDIYNFLQIKNTKGFLAVFNQYGYRGIFKLFKEIPVVAIIYLVLMILINVFFLGSLLFFLFKPSDNIYNKVFIFVIISYVALFTGPIGASRFRIPIYPFILLTLPEIKSNRL